MDNIDEKIEPLKKSIEKRFEEKAEEIRIAQEAGLAQFSAALVTEKDKLIKELDDRLEIIKQFPSVLEADRVFMHTLAAMYSTPEIRFNNLVDSNRNQVSDYLEGTGKWKILILAKRVE